MLVKASAGGGGRGMRVVANWPTLPAEVAGRPARSAVRVRRPDRVLRALPAHRPPHRGAGAGRRARHRVGRRRTGMLDPAPPPEGHRRGAVSVGRAHHRACASKLFDAARLAAERDRLHRRGHRRVPRRRRRRVLLPGDEHPAAGRAPGHRGDHRARSRRAAALGRRRRAARCPNRPPPHGHSIEARLYAEDPRTRLAAAGRARCTRSTCRRSRPQFGTLGQRHRDPAGFRHRRRVGGVDPLRPDARQGHLLCSHAPAVGAGARRRAGPHPAARRAAPTATLLVNVLRHPAFLDGATDTAFFDTHGLDGAVRAAGRRRDGPVVGDRRGSGRRRTQPRAAHRCSAAIPSGWRNLASGNQAKTYRDDADAEHRVEYRFTRTGLVLPGDESRAAGVRHARRGRARRRRRGVRCSYAVRRYGDEIYVDSARGPVHLVALPRFPEPGSAVEKGSLVAPMPGNVIRLGAQVGDTVTAGQPLIWLEAMKMEHTITAPADGVLAELNVTTGQQVEVGAVLARVEAPESEGGCSMTDTSFIESEERQALRKAVSAMGVQLRQRVLPAEGARARAHRRIMVGGRQTRLPRGEPARGVRRWRRRHVRAVAGDGGDGGRRQRAAADGGLAGHQRHHHQQVRHRRAEEALDSGRSPTAR